MIKQRSFSLFLFCIGFFFIAAAFFVPVSVLAQTSELAETGATSGLGTADLTTIIGSIINTILSILGIVLLGIVIYAGFLWMTAAGDPDKVAKAKQWMINGVIGLIIILSSYAISSFIINALTGALSDGGSSTEIDADDYPSIERRSGSLGSGGIQDHYPNRNASDVPRNAKILVTFKSAMDIESFIDGYDDGGTPEDTSDDITSTALNVDNVLIYPTAEGEGAALEEDEVVVRFSDDLQTFSFAPVAYLGSASEDVSYTVLLSDDLVDVDGDQMIRTGGYEWSFEVGTEVDLTPPSVVSVSPRAGGVYDRNIAVQIRFSEAIDPTSATGIREAESGFSHIQTYAADGAPLSGAYVISDGYETITFTTDAPCGTNSCGETVYCLPGDADVTVDILAATMDTDTPPQAATFPYDGVVDAASNVLDGDGDGDAGDDYSWSFATSDDYYAEGPTIESVSPAILEEDVSLDEDVVVRFGEELLSSSVTSAHISLETNPAHELWYSLRTVEVDSEGVEVTDDDTVVAGTNVVLRHGVFLESSEDALTGESCTEDADCGDGERCNSDGQCYEPGVTFLYAPAIGSGVKNQYQNCYVPGYGPSADGGSCEVTKDRPYCCNGEAQATACDYFVD